MNTIEVDSVNLSFNGRRILSDIYLRCETGEIVGLIGRNGAGKSCLMKIIFGSLRGENQSVRLNGKYTEQLFTKSNTVHFLHQDGFAMNYLSFDDLVKVFDLNEKLNQILEIEEINRNRKKKIGTLSHGEKKLIEIAALLYAKGQFVILDEPFSYLSPVLVEKIFTHIKAQSKHKGILITDHLYQAVLSVCTKYYVLRSGALTEINQVSQLEDFGYLPQENRESSH